MRRKPCYFDYCNYMMWRVDKDEKTDVDVVNRRVVAKCLGDADPEIGKIILEIYEQKVDIPMAVAIVSANRGISQDVLYTVLSKFCLSLAKERGLL